jgi:hypothetical protein
MSLRRLVSCVSCGLCFPALAAAAYKAPQFTLSHPGSQTGFTDGQTVEVTVTYPANPHPGALWCITQDATLKYCQSGASWTSLPSQFTLTGGDGLNKVYLEYKYNTTASAPGEAQVTLDLQPPAVTLSAPAGLPGALPGGLQQMIAMSAQFVTGSVSDAVSTDPVTITLNACNQQEICTNVNTISPAASPFVWTWPLSGVSSDTAYMQIEAVNAAGKSSSTAVPNPATFFSVFAPGSITSPITCSVTACPTVAGPLSAAQYMPNDPPSPTVDGNTFTGYADPSVRREAAVSASNPNGLNLWMLYSHPDVQTNTTYGTASEMVDVHLASSRDSGNTWQAWCTPAPCTAETPMWPSYHWLPATGQIEQFSSHEVANFWPYSSDNVNWKWYAVHMMYFVQPPHDIPYSIAKNGCLVTTVATTPPDLGEGWTGIAQPPPSSCTASMPEGSHVIAYATLTAAAGAHAPKGVSCVWGEPAIMVQSGTAYLAASCFNSDLYSYGYYTFANTLDASGGLSGPWSYYGGPFTVVDLKELTPKAQFVTEFDWAERSDGSLVAVVSPASIANHVETQYGCISLDFTLAGGFGTAVIALNDQDPLESNGPNACTYEPTSNTGVLIVRKLVNGPNYTAWSLTASGLMP